MKVSEALPHSPYVVHPKYFQCVDVATVKQLCEIILRSHWSPIIWKNGERLGDNFLSSEFLVFDFEDAWKVEDAVRFCEKNNYLSIIGSTEHHRIPKGDKPPSDRFRLIIPWHEPILDKFTHMQNMRRLTSLVGSDVSCYDAARKYKPCKQILFLQAGDRIKWKTYKKPKERKPTGAMQAGIIPAWLQAKLKEAPIPGERNKFTFILACQLAAHGLSQSEVTETILSCPIDLPQKDKITTSISGYKRGILNLKQRR